MVAPWQETQYRVVVEFKKGGSGVKREITMDHRPDVLPPQLHGRVTPQEWSVFMTEVAQLVYSHPYTQAPSAEYCCNFAANMACLLAIGFGCFQGDSGNYGPWLAQLQQILDRHAAAFAAGGASLRINHVHGSYWVEINVDPTFMAVGAPVPAGVPVYYPPPGAAPAGYPQPGGPPPPGYPTKA
ncbi:hypothetical protein CHLRE_16g673505v5 [Chlamydomonas reinhardtii]|uniref:Uncharacterized protein n=1 Tax=Chlamydomonas reinhardtii TaxID=3055 RepID=A8J3C5_CHLRE|nr:uncharacterized protein CHLRE_16g673505v5 [Chlamydomonas reinhardtii]PNW72374.1 hypothetical protein CHLRE_16g673505v5 [Chlamydomonas reinhardtii]|eukprot:XP_001695790.1 predicted protein [Chlamydomonas reinhardtii]